MRVLVTGANKGIGRAIVERLLAEHSDVHVFLGSRDRGRGDAARDALVGAGAAPERVAVVAIDVADESSVVAAAEELGALDGLVHNAGIGRHGHTFGDVLEVNAYGTWRVCQAFAPAMPAGGRVVIVSSASGPSFVSKCSAERQAQLTDPAIEWEALDALIQETLALDGAAAFRAAGLGDGDAYGFSKACVNAIMHIVARTYPALGVNSCTPGFVATDMTRPYADAQGTDPSEMGMKTPHEGASCPLHLLFAELAGNGWYYGSDAQRSPLDRYRSPGDLPFTG